jgi:hypothetical protein
MVEEEPSDERTKQVLPLRGRMTGRKNRTSRQKNKTEGVRD